MKKRIVIMLVAVGLLFGAIFGYHAVKSREQKEKMASFRPPPATVTAIKVEYQSWQPELKSVGSLRAARGVDVTSEVTGLVSAVFCRSGADAKKGQVLVQLNADSDVALLHSLEAQAALAQTVYERDKKQFDAQAISRATLDSDAFDLKNKSALVTEQAALVEKKTIRAPFDGRLGISTVNPGQYINPGDKIVTLQALDLIYSDFYLPQQELSNISPGQAVVATTDAYPGRAFTGRITTIDPKVDTATRNFQVEATFLSPGHKLLPGMYVSVQVKAGAEQRYLTLPQTAVTFNPYGETVFVVESGKGPQGKPILTVRQTFVTTGPTRGDQIAILKGIKEGDMVVTSGQLKLKNGGTVVINNAIIPTNEAAPMPKDE
jgi:membrane fusion protein (multidrug efflux system)